MKRKYYMRGLGIGILVTAILMSVTIHGKTEELTNEEIMERARELGMVERYDSTVLAESSEEVFPAETDSPKESDAIGAVSENTTKTPEETPEPEETTPSESGKQMVQITVQGGDGSQAVAQKLKNAGLISDIVAYDKFLCQNGYDRRICTGVHSIPVGATEEEIARILMTRP